MIRPQADSRDACNLKPRALPSDQSTCDDQIALWRPLSLGSKSKSTFASDLVYVVVVDIVLLQLEVRHTPL
jgi:hypothetical protein